MKKTCEIIRCMEKHWLTSEEAFSIYAPCMYQPTYEDYKALMEKFLSDPSVKIFVCDMDGEKAGILVLKETEAAELKEDEISAPKESEAAVGLETEAEAEILGIAVRKDLRGKGIGKEMVCQVMEAEHLKKITAQTDDDAIGFYRKSGFEAERVVIEYPNGSVVRYNCTRRK